MSGISIREFAKLSGVHHVVVRRAVQSGDLGALSDGTLDQYLVGTDWRKSSRDSAPAMTEYRANTRTQEVLAAMVVLLTARQSAFIPQLTRCGKSKVEAIRELINIGIEYHENETEKRDIEWNDHCKKNGRTDLLCSVRKRRSARYFE